METLDLKSDLRQRTAAAWRQPDGRASSAALAPETGEVYAFNECPDAGIEWLVLDAEDVTRRCLLIPIDNVTWIGTPDVAVQAQEAGALSLRCDLGFWLDQEVLHERRRRTVLAADDLERAQTRRRQLLFRNVEATDDEREMDTDPDYLDWRGVLASARDVLVAAYHGYAEELQPRSPAEARPPVPANEDAASAEEPAGGEVPSRSGGFPRRYMALAASVAVALTAASFFLGRRLEEDRSDEMEAALRAAHADEVAVLRLENLRATSDEVAVPWLLAPFGNRRGPEPERLVVPPEARTIAFMVDAAEGDRLEISTLDGALIIARTIASLTSDDEVLVLLPAALLPAGDYRVVVRHMDRPEVSFRLRVEVPDASR